MKKQKPQIQPDQPLIPQAQRLRLEDAVRRTLEQEEKTAAVLTQLAEEERELKRLTETVLPELLQELGTSAVTLADGTTVKVGEHLTASVSQRNEAAAAKIFKRLGAGDMVQLQVTSAFGPRDKELLTALLTFSEKVKLPLAKKNVVNPASLKAWVREQKALGRLQPSELEVLGVFSQVYATVKQPKME